MRVYRVSYSRSGVKAWVVECLGVYVTVNPRTVWVHRLGTHEPIAHFRRPVWALLSRLRGDR